MDYPIFDGNIEIRQDGAKGLLTARFPLNVTATISNTGRTRKERFNSGSMSWQVREFGKLQAQMGQVIQSAISDVQKQAAVAKLEDALEKRNTFLLAGHSYDRPIADMKSGTLRVRETPDYMELEADLPPESMQPSWVRDTVLGIQGGQVRGVSPSFNVTSKGAERFVPEPRADGNSMIREIMDSVVDHYGLVARPAYPLTEVDTRAYRGFIPIRKRFWL